MTNEKQLAPGSILIAVAAPRFLYKVTLTKDWPFNDVIRRRRSDRPRRTTDPTPTVLKRYGYVYAPVGNRTTEQIDDAPRTWTYDAMNRMTAQAGGGALRFAGTVTEPAGVTVQGRPAVVDGNNSFAGTAIVGPGTNTVGVTATDASGKTTTANYEVDVAAASGSFTYDANGNLTTQGTKTYEWNARDELMRVLDGGVEVAAFAYDGFGRRVEKTVGGVTRRFVYAVCQMSSPWRPVPTIRSR